MIPLRNFISDTVDSVRPDSLSRLFNNLWGSYSNTHMRRLPDGTWEITGHAIQYTGYFAGLMMCTSVPQSPLIHLDKSWDEILKANGLSAWFDKDASGFQIVRIAPHDPTDPECHPGVCVPEGVGVCCSDGILDTICPCPVPED